MGLFSGKTITSVASVAYNLAGDEAKRPNFLKTTIASAITGSVPSIPDYLVNSHLGGPAMKIRSFHGWAQNTGYYDLIGTVNSSLSLGNTIDTAVLATFITPVEGEYVDITSTEIAVADWVWWAEQRVLETHPELFSTNWTAEISPAPYWITITYEDASTDAFQPVGFVPGSLYLIADYTEVDFEEVAPVPPETEPTIKTIPYQRRYFIYRRGAGNAVIDAMFSGGSNFGGFVPFIPIRIANKFVSTTNYPALYKPSKRALRKSIGASYDNLIDSIADNPNLGDIDYAYVMFGVSLNVQENACRHYIYEFFQAMMENQTENGQVIWQTFHDQWMAAHASQLAWKTWSETGSSGSYFFGSRPVTEPVKIPYPPMPSNAIQIASSKQNYINFNITINWNTQYETTGTGLIKPDAKAGDVWIELEPIIELPKLETDTDSSTGMLSWRTRKVETDKLVINWQETNNRWKKMHIFGLQHVNRIYAGKSVVTTARSALSDSDETGFIIPLHDAIFKRTNLISATQMATANAFIVFNCYVQKKTKWYQSGAFQILLVIIIIVVSIIAPPAGGAAGGAGVLGTNAAIGAAAGLTGMAAIVVGAIINAIAAMLIARIITEASVALLGDKMGQIVGLVASIVALNMVSSYQAGNGFTMDYNSLTRADNLMRLSMSGLSTYANVINADTMEIVQQTQEVVSEYNDKTKEIQQALRELTGTSGVDPALVSMAAAVRFESPETFLTRTLLTGSDISDLSIEMISKFTAINLDLDLPFI
jgi:hypothetical protein